jgi:hypothetical protein
MKTTTLRWAQAVTCASLMAIGAVGRTHELVCEKTVNQQQIFQVSSYPTTLHYQFTITNTHPTDHSIALSADDTLLAAFGFSFSPPPPIDLDVGMSVSDTFDLVVHDAGECARLAASDDLPTDLNIDNVLVVTWDLGATQCSARVICLPEVCRENCTPPPSGGATRTMGFFKTHEQALTQCLAGGSIDLGFVTVSTLTDALGLLWGSPVKFGDGSTRDTLDKDRFLLARQTLVGICNERLFGTAPTPSTLLDDAVAALGGTDCAMILTLESQVDAFNNSGDAVAFPSGFMPGSATPQHAMSIAVDPTSSSGQSCNP